MKYHLNLFNPETWEAFREAGATVTGFRERHRRLAEERVSPGDIFLCYLTRLSRWCGVLEIESGPYFDTSPVFPGPEQYPIRFKVKSIALLAPEDAIPIQEERVWKTLSVTNQYDMGHPHWTGFFRSPLKTFENEDGDFLTKLIEGQFANPERFPLTNKERGQLTRKRVWPTVRDEKPSHEGEDTSPSTETADPAVGSESRESIRYQAKVAQIGAEMGFDIWVPKVDRARVQGYVLPQLHNRFLDELPLNYNDKTLRTIEQIDVLWIKDRSMARAFEIEHTTAIYSGLLRMADLLALQRNMNIRLHIVAPLDKRDRVLREIERPVFSQLRLHDQCSFLSYDSIDSLAREQHVSYMSDAVIAEYEVTVKV